MGLCRFFKQDRDVPVIVVSVLECQDQAIEAGADAFLPKPLEPLLESPTSAGPVLDGQAQRCHHVVQAGEGGVAW